MGFLPVLIATNVLRSKGLWPGSQATQVDSDDDVSCVPVIVLGVVTEILCVGTIAAAIRSHNWPLCAAVGALLAANSGLLYLLCKK